MLFKLLGIELANRHSQADGVKKWRQVFLTQSHVLVHRVSEYYKQLIRAAEFANNQHHNDPGQSVDMQGSIDGNIGDTTLTAVGEGLIQLDEEDDERTDLPSKFSELEDKDFPLFATFDQVGIPYQCRTYAKLH
jgi:hypothetical protein